MTNHLSSVEFIFPKAAKPTTRLLPAPKAKTTYALAVKRRLLKGLRGMYE